MARPAPAPVGVTGRLNGSVDAASTAPEPAAEGSDPAPGGGPLRLERATGLLFAGLVALAASGPISDNSLLTHLATGRLQVDSGLPGQNPFLTTSVDFPVPSWWWSGLLGWTEHLGGLAGVRLLTVVVAAVLGFVMVRASRPHATPGAPATGPLTQALPAAVVLALLIPSLNARPHLAGWVLLALALVVWRERLSAWWMVPLFAIWVNVHGTWLHGAGVLVLLWLAEVLDDRRLQPDRLRVAAAAAGGVLLGGIAYPETFRLVLLPTEQLGSPAAREAIQHYREWRPPSLDSPWLWCFLLVAVLGLYGALAARRSGRIRWGSVLAVAVLGLMGVSAVRLLPVAAITLAAFAASGIAQVSGLSTPPSMVRRTISGLGVAALAAACLQAVSGPHTDLSRFPVEEVDWLEQRGLVADPGVRLLHNDWVGNYLEFRYGSDANAWVDDRPSVETLIDYVALRHTAEGWTDALERAEPDVVLWQTGDELPDALARDAAWEETLTTDDFRVFCREGIVQRCR